MNRSQRSGFWQRPEGVTGMIFLAAMLLGGGVLVFSLLPYIAAILSNTAYVAAIMAAVAGSVYVLLDGKARASVAYLFQSAMRWITGLFVKIDPISVLKGHLEHLEGSLSKMGAQIGALRGQMRALKATMDQNAADIQENVRLAEKAKASDDAKNMTLFARKAGRLQEANAKYAVLYGKMEVLYKVLAKMYENSEIVLEDTADQIKLKEQEYVAIKTSHGAIKSAMSVIGGNPDQRALFDQALEHLAADVGNRVGEMERFMDTSKGLMDSIDLQNGVFEEEGLKMLEQLEKSPLVLDKATGLLDLNAPRKEPLREERTEKNGYEDFF